MFRYYVLGGDTAAPSRLYAIALSRISSCTFSADADSETISKSVNIL